MTIEAKLALLQQAATEQTNACEKLITDVEQSITEIDQVKVDMHSTHDLIKANHQAINDWQTKTGKVSLKDLNGQSYQVDSLSDLINETQKINPHPEVMTKAQYDALRQMRKQQYAGSGFVEWGKHIAHLNTHEAVNEGMWTWNLSPSRLSLGAFETDSGFQGISRVIRPQVMIDGVLQKLSYLASSTYNNILFPPAPDGTKTYDSATGKVTQHASAKEAFCGLATNGAFTDDLNGWHAWGNASLSMSNGIANIKAANPSDGVTYAVDADLQANAEYVTEWLINYPEGKTFVLGFYNAQEGYKVTQHVGTGKPTLYKTTYKPSETISGNGHNIRCYHHDASDTELEWQVYYASCRAVTEQVITSRKDLVFLESWHEKIADKDVVYPLGNVQYGANIYEGITLASNLTAQGYSAFGEWDTDTKGYGVKWSTLSAANRVKFLKNPEHNIYYDPEAKAYIQVRYRVRVVEGLADEWADPLTLDEGFFLREKGFNRLAVVARGKQIEFNDRTTGFYSHDSYIHKEGSYAWVNELQYPLGQGAVYATDSMRDDHGHESKCFAMPIALVQRLNQGGYHPSYNPMGCRRFLKSGLGHEPWYKKAAEDIASTIQCFDIGNATDYSRVSGNSGFIGSNADTGRPDQYKYYDAIYAGQVEDLRLNANKLDVNQLREDTMRKAVAGTLRGKGSLPILCISGPFTVQAAVGESASDGRIRIPTSLTGELTPTFSYRFGGNSDVYLCSDEGDLVTVPLGISKYSHIHIQFSNNGNLYLGCSSYSETASSINDKLRGKQCRLIWAGQLDRPFGKIEGHASMPLRDEHCKFLSASHLLYHGNKPEFDSLPWADIIGHPERIAATFPDGVVGQWIPKIPDNTSGYQLNRKMTNNQLIAKYSEDLGQTWVSASVNFGTAENINSDSWNPNVVALLNYQTPAHFTQTSNQQGVLGSIGNVYATQASQTAYGNRLQPSLTGKVGTRSNGALIHEEVLLNKLSRYAPTGQLTWTQSLGDEPKHAPLNLDSQSEPSSAIKTLSTVIEKNGLLYLQFNGAELKYTQQPVVDISESSTEGKEGYGVFRVTDGPLKGRMLKRKFNTTSFEAFNDINWSIDSKGLLYKNNKDYSYEFFNPSYNWGDDQTIPIINGENTKTDLNGNTVKVFCHHTQLPLGIASH